MAVTPPAVGSQNWGGPLNDILTALDVRMAKLEVIPTGGMKQTVAQSGWATAVAGTVTFGATTHNTRSFVDLANNRMVVPVNGIYSIYGLVAFAPNSTGYRRAAININGSGLADCGMDTNTQSGLAGIAAIRIDLPLVIGDAITLGGFQNSGTTLSTTVTSPYYSFLVAHMVLAT
jgi:hypothetical protein